RLLAPDQVNEDGYGQRQRTEQQIWIQKRHKSDALRTCRQIGEQRRVQRLAGIDQTIVDTHAGQFLANSLHVIFQDVEILRSQIFGNDVQFPFRLHVFKLRHVLERKCQLEVVHDMEDDNVVRFRLEHFQTGNAVLRLIIQIRNQNDHASPREKFG